MGQLTLDQALERVDQLMHGIGWQIEAEQLDRNQPLAFCVISPKDRTKGASANLMQHAKRAERVRYRRAASVGVQLKNSCEEGA